MCNKDEPQLTEHFSALKTFHKRMNSLNLAKHPKKKKWHRQLKSAKERCVVFIDNKLCMGKSKDKMSAKQPKKQG